MTHGLLAVDETPVSGNVQSACVYTCVCTSKSFHCCPVSLMKCVVESYASGCDVVVAASMVMVLFANDYQIH